LGTRLLICHSKIDALVRRKNDPQSSKGDPIPTEKSKRVGLGNTSTNTNSTSSKLLSPLRHDHVDMEQRVLAAIANFTTLQPTPKSVSTMDVVQLPLRHFYQPQWDTTTQSILRRCMGRFPRAPMTTAGCSILTVNNSTLLMMPNRSTRTINPKLGYPLVTTTTTNRHRMLPSKSSLGKVKASAIVVLAALEIPKTVNLNNARHADSVVAYLV